MEIKYFDSGLVKEKFAFLLAKLHDAAFLTDYINDVIIKSPFFDCFENNDLTDFMTLSFETITEKCFGKEVIYDYSHNLINAYYWAGLKIMEIMMNLEIPLKRILIVMPLKEIVGLYEPYHEMHPEQFLKHYQELENQRSVLKSLRNTANLSISKISYLTDIKTPLLNIIDKSNATLFGTSFSNLTKLASLFNVSTNIFKKKTSYAPFSSLIIDSKTTEPILIKHILAYFNFASDGNVTITRNYLEDKDIKNLLKQHKVVVDLSNPFGVLYISSNRINRKYMTNEEFTFIYLKTINELRLKVEGLLF